METRKSYSVRFGKHLRKLRVEKKLSLRELALEIDSDKPTISKIENGQMVPSVHFLARLCKGLKMSEAEFFQDFESDQ